ncbi:MAG: hypothetical protein ACRCXW_00940 [Plesiomonas shigelloides]
MKSSLKEYDLISSGDLPAYVAIRPAPFLAGFGELHRHRLAQLRSAVIGLKKFTD